MSNEVINQEPTIERATELEQQAKDGLNQLKAGQDKAINACHKMRDTKAYKALGFESYYVWGETTLNLKKSRLNELAQAGEVHQELLTGVTTPVKPQETQDAMEVPNAVEDNVSSNDSSAPEPTSEPTEKQALSSASREPLISSADLSDISTPQLLALAKAPKGERLAILDMAAVEAKAEDKPLTTNTIKEAIKASTKPNVPSADEKVAATKKQHKSAMLKVSKLGETLNELDTTNISSEEIVSWKAHLEDVKESIKTLERELGYE